MPSPPLKPQAEASASAARQKIIVVQGPTGVGKTAVALGLARQLRGEIVNADSMQFYRHMDIGTSKPTAAEQAAFPHHLFSIVNPDEAFNAARFMREARAAIADIAARGSVPLVVGGTGLYVRALTRGLSSAPAGDEQLRRELKRLGKAELHARLQQVDSAAAGRISPNDVVRMVRALEVHSLTGETLSQHNTRHAFQDAPYACLKLCLTRSRQELYSRINARVQAMLDAGLVAEVKDLLARGYGPELRPLASIGYKQIVEHLRGSRSLAEAVRLIQQETRQLAKRQLTWLRPDPENIWIELPAGQADILALAKKFLNIG